MKEKLKWLAGNWHRAAFFGLAMLVVATGREASAQSGAVPACDALNTPATANVQNAIGCMLGTVQPNAILVSIVTAFVPILLVIWGARGGFALIATVVRRMFGFMTGKA